MVFYGILWYIIGYGVQFPCLEYADLRETFVDFLRMLAALAIEARLPVTRATRRRVPVQRKTFISRLISRVDIPFSELRRLHGEFPPYACLVGKGGIDPYRIPGHVDGPSFST